MNLANYIQSGKPCQNSRLSLIFGLISLLFSGFVYLLSTYLLTTKEMKDFIKNLPTIQIEKEQVISPIDFSFEQKIPFTNSYVLIDTKQGEPTQTVASGVMLTKTHIVITIDGQVQMYQLPPEKTTLDPTFIKNLLGQGIQNMAIVLAVILFILMWLGFMLTLILAQLLLTIFRKQMPKDMLKRSTCVGWFSVIALNLILLGFGYALSLIVAVPVAVAISLFCLFKS